MIPNLDLFPAANLALLLNIVFPYRQFEPVFLCELLQFYRGNLPEISHTSVYTGLDFDQSVSKITIGIPTAVAPIQKLALSLPV
jgi:hypothetical protein